MIQPKADHQGSKIPSTDFRWIGRSFVEKALSNNNYLVRKVGTDNTQILHCMQLRPFRLRGPIPVVLTMSKEWTLDPEFIIKLDDLYDRAWESEFGKPIFDDNEDRPSPPNPCKGAIESDHANAETCITPGTERGKSPKIFLSSDRLSDGTDRYPYMEPDAEISSEQPKPISTNPCSTKNNLGHNPKANCYDDYRYNIVTVIFRSLLAPTTEHIHTRSQNA